MKAKLPIALVASLLIAGSAYADGNITGLVFNKNTSEIPNMCNKHKNYHHRQFLIPYHKKR